MIFGEEYREANTHKNRPEMPPNAIKTYVIHTTRKAKSILLFFPPYFELFRTIDIFHTNSYNNAITQCHVDGAQRAWATCENNMDCSNSSSVQ